MANRILVTCFFVFAAALGYAQDGSIVLKGQQAPNLTINTDDGKAIKLSDMKGKVVLINFFATWCGPCNMELPVVQEKIWMKYKDNSNFSLLSFGRGHTSAEINEFKAAKKFDFPIYPDKDKSIYGLFASKSIPRNYIVDKTGTVVYASIGYTAEEFEEMMAVLDRLLKADEY